MKGKMKLLGKLPRMITIPGMTKEQYRAIQLKGHVPDLKPETLEYLIKQGFVEITEIEIEKGAVKDATNSTD